MKSNLDKLAGNRDFITTDEFAEILSFSSQTIRKNYSLYNNFNGLIPLKLGNKLLWKITDIKKLLNMEEETK